MNPKDTASLAPSRLSAAVAELAAVAETWPTERVYTEYRAAYARCAHDMIISCLGDIYVSRILGIPLA